ncbi:CBS domain-containing protein [Methylocystis sp. IM2]
MRVVEVLTRDIKSCLPNALLSDVWTLMKTEGLLHVPVVDEDVKVFGSDQRTRCATSALERGRRRRASVRLCHGHWISLNG